MAINKRKVLIYGGGFAAFLVLVLLLRNLSGGGAGSTTSGGGVVTLTPTGPTDAQLQASTSVQLAQIGAAAQAADSAAQLTMARDAIAADLAKTAAQADLARYTIGADAAGREAADIRATELARFTAQSQAQLAAQQLGAQTQLAQMQIDAADRSDARSANLTASVTKWQLDTQLAMNQQNNAFQLDFAESAHNNLEQLALISASSQRDFYDSQTKLAQTSADRDIALAKVNKKKSGGILGAITSIAKTALPLVL